MVRQWQRLCGANLEAHLIVEPGLRRRGGGGNDVVVNWIDPVNVESKAFRELHRVTSVATADVHRLGLRRQTQRT